jgi:ribose-phosphate pyrophosphokinase
MAKYSDGEFQPSYEESIRGYAYCFHFSKFRQSDGIATMIDAAKRAQQDSNTLLVRVEMIEKDKPRVPIEQNNNKTVRNCRSKWQQWICMQIKFKEKPVDHLLLQLSFLPT